MKRKTKTKPNSCMASGWSQLLPCPERGWSSWMCRTEMPFPCHIACWHLLFRRQLLPNSSLCPTLLCQPLTAGTEGAGKQGSLGWCALHARYVPNLGQSCTPRHCAVLLDEWRVGMATTCTVCLCFSVHFAIFQGQLLLEVDFLFFSGGGEINYHPRFYCCPEDQK